MDQNGGHHPKKDDRERQQKEAPHREPASGSDRAGRILQVTAAIKEGFSGSYQISFCVIEAIAGASEITKPVIE